VYLHIRQHLLAPSPVFRRDLVFPAFRSISGAGVSADMLREDIFLSVMAFMAIYYNQFVLSSIFSVVFRVFQGFFDFFEIL